MPSSEKVVSPGVFTNEIDQTFLPAAIGDIGAALVGPTVKGPPLIPTVVSSYSEFQAIFGDTFKHGVTGSSYSYLTSMTARNYLQHSGQLTVVRIMDGEYTNAYAGVPTGSLLEVVTDGGIWTGSAFHGGHLGTDGATELHSNGLNESFKLNAIAYGNKMNNFNTMTTTTPAGISISSSNAVLTSGSKDNVRWEVTGTDPDKGTFNLLIRRGDDTVKRKQILETWNNLSLDPFADNYISKVIGDSKPVMSGDETDPYIAMSGSYTNKSKYVYISDVMNTPNYLDENGNVRDVKGPAGGTLHQSASLPGVGSGSFLGTFLSGSDGFVGFDPLGNPLGFNGGQDEAGYTPPAAIATPEDALYYESISTVSQGFLPETDNSGSTAYTKALNLLKNQDEYDFNLLMLPGILASKHPTTFQKAIDICEERADAFAVLDLEPYSTTNISTVTDTAEGYDSNYVASYWPWIQVPEVELGRNVWVPPSVVIPGVLAFNDKVSHEWFAPAGLNRGGIDTAVQAARKLTATNRDTLYESNVNPIATFPGQGVVVWGQKTLQKKSSALDRVNVRRLMIRLKKFIASSSRFLVFEQNTSKTRQRFLNIVNPFLEQVQANSGLSAFRVVMDETNNTPDVIDRNILYGQIFVQPTRTAEFIVLDFTLQPTGATFPE